MVLYFSGTGNSEYVAKRIAGALGDEAVNIFDRIKAREHSVFESKKSYVVVAPVYAYQLPQIVGEWLTTAKLKGNRDLYFVLTCGSSIAGAGYFNREIVFKKRMNYMGTAKVVMPENYIAMFKAPQEEKALAIIDRSEEKIDLIIAFIKTHRILTDEGGTVKQLWSSFINRIFFKFLVKDKRFYVTDKCTGCGKCARECVMKNITVKNRTPVWHGKCTHCMACICKCPAAAIEYGHRTKKRVRYICPKK